MLPDLDSLALFVRAAEMRNLTRAAERVFTSPPAVSAQLKALEDEFGVRLFERGPRGMTLTPAGERLLAEARRVGPVVVGGDLYRLAWVDESNWPAVQFVSRDADTAVNHAKARGGDDVAIFDTSIRSPPRCAGRRRRPAPPRSASGCRRSPSG